MGFTKVSRIHRFTDTLKPRIEDVETAWHGCYINDNNLAGSMTKTLIRHAVAADFSQLLEIDQASFAGGVAYDAAELSYFMKRPGAETLVLEEASRVVAYLILE